MGGKTRKKEKISINFIRFDFVSFRTSFLPSLPEPTTFFYVSGKRCGKMCIIRKACDGGGAWKEEPEVLGMGYSLLPRKRLAQKPMLAIKSG